MTNPFLLASCLGRLPKAAGRHDCVTVKGARSAFLLSGIPKVMFEGKTLLRGAQG